MVVHQPSLPGLCPFGCLTRQFLPGYSQPRLTALIPSWVFPKAFRGRSVLHLWLVRNCLLQTLSFVMLGVTKIAGFFSDGYCPGLLGARKSPRRSRHSGCVKQPKSCWGAGSLAGEPLSPLLSPEPGSKARRLALPQSSGFERRQAKPQRPGFALPFSCGAEGFELARQFLALHIFQVQSRSIIAQKYLDFGCLLSTGFVASHRIRIIEDRKDTMNGMP